MGDKLVFRISLTQVPSVGAIIAKQLISYCGSAEAVFKTPKKQLLKIPGIGLQTAMSIVNFKDFEIAEREVQFLERNRVRALFYLDTDYPDRLKHFPDAPVFLFVRGTADLNPERTIAVVGTRQPSPLGVATCEEIIHSLSPYNVQVISGLAYGIDGAAHKAALNASLSTLAVLGHGLDQIYPMAHKGLSEEIVSQNGALLTEFVSDAGPDRENFPKRNRIVAAMSDALLVIETGERGGSMISAHLANDYHKDVFALPGRVKDPKSKGCNLLIKTHKAGLIESGEDIAYFMRWDPPEKSKSGVQTSLFYDLTSNEKAVLDLMQKQADPWSIDRLSYQTQLNGSEIAAVLLNLEFKGLVKSLPGKRFMPI